ncbi:hypothetical protein HMPREF9278_2135 [Mobiluncus mulieris FB024-16]|nr:hypothetical protein HMPREF9278_2135 [Mobiluncus mulieris FB024-16]
MRPTEKLARGTGRPGHVNALRVGKHLAVHNPVPGGAAQIEELAGVAQPGESAVVKALPR